jgi:hypothetical protein
LKLNYDIANPASNFLTLDGIAGQRSRDLLDDDIPLSGHQRSESRENDAENALSSPTGDYAPFNPYTFSQSPVRLATTQARNTEGVKEQAEDDREDSSPPPIQSRTNSNQVEKHQCGQCDEHKSDSYYCNLCDMTYCGGCWNRVGPHKSGKVGPGGIPHEKTDQVIADKLRATLEASPNDIEQQELFRNDENTAWFGVVKDESGDSIFYDYGRYADIMTEISQITGPRQRQGSRFPGLVSFVGETGEVMLHLTAIAKTDLIVKVLENLP